MPKSYFEKLEAVSGVNDYWNWNITGSILCQSPLHRSPQVRYSVCGIWSGSTWYLWVRPGDLSHRWITRLELGIRNSHCFIAKGMVRVCIHSFICFSWGQRAGSRGEDWKHWMILPPALFTLLHRGVASRLIDKEDLKAAILALLNRHIVHDADEVQKPSYGMVIAIKTTSAVAPEKRAWLRWARVAIYSS